MLSLPVSAPTVLVGSKADGTIQTGPHPGLIDLQPEAMWEGHSLSPRAGESWKGLEGSPCLLLGLPLGQS